LFESVTKENVEISSPPYDVLLGIEKAKFVISLYPKGEGDDGGRWVSLYLRTLGSLNHSSRHNRGIYLHCTITTADGEITELKDQIKCHELDIDSESGNGWSRFCEIDTFVKLFCNGELTIVADLTIDLNESANTFVENIKAIQSFESFSDLTVVCGQKKFRCHKNIFASRSSLFKSMLEAEMKEKQTNEINITDSNPEHVQMMIDYIYADELPQNLSDVAADLLHLAVKYDLQGLTNACEDSLVSNLNKDNALTSLVTLDTYMPTSIKRQVVLEYIASNALDIIDSEHWKIFVKNHNSLVTEVFRCLATMREVEQASSAYKLACSAELIAQLTSNHAEQLACCDSPVIFLAVLEKQLRLAMDSRNTILNRNFNV